MPSEPRSLALSRNCRPTIPPVMTGGTSSPLNLRCAVFRAAGFEADVVARQQGAEPGDPAQGDARAHDPELGVFHHQARRALGDLGGDFHLAEILRQAHRRDLADVHVLVLEEGLARLDAFGGPEHDRDARALAQDALDRDPDGHHGGQDRDDPHRRDAGVLGRHDGGPRQLAEVSVFSHAQAAGGCLNPTADEDRTTAPRAW